MRVTVRGRVGGRPPVGRPMGPSSPGSRGLLGVGSVALFRRVGFVERTRGPGWQEQGTGVLPGTVKGSVPADRRPCRV